MRSVYGDGSSVLLDTCSRLTVHGQEVLRHLLFNQTRACVYRHVRHNSLPLVLIVPGMFPVFLLIQVSGHAGS
jgi:hypothetical protein